jgi:hypothetical protein
VKSWNSKRWKSHHLKKNLYLYISQMKQISIIFIRQFMLTTSRWRTIWIMKTLINQLHSMFRNCPWTQTYPWRPSKTHAIVFTRSLIEDTSHHRWLHEPLDGLPQKQQLPYIVKIMTQFQISLTMINFHHSLWKVVLKEKVMSWPLNIKMFLWMFKEIC